MNTYKKLLIPFLVLLAIFVGFYFLRNRPQLAPTQTERATSETKANLSINDGANSQNFDISQFAGKTALEATQGVATVEVSGTGANAFVKAVNGRAADSVKHEFWELLVNGAPSDVGAGSYIIKNGDLLEWHINTY